MAAAKITIQHVWCIGPRWTSLLSSAMPTDCYVPLSIVAGNGRRWTRFTIYCGWQWPSMDMGHNLLWPAVVIDGHASCGGQYISFENTTSLFVADNNPSIDSSLVHCLRQYLSMETLHSLLPQTSIDRCVPSPLSTTISIDRHLPQSIVADNNSSIDPSLVLRLRQYLTMETKVHCRRNIYR